MYHLIWTVSVFGSRNRNTGGIDLSARRAMHIRAQKPRGRTPLLVDARLKGAAPLRLSRVPTMGFVRAAFVRAMCIARRALKLSLPVFLFREPKTLPVQIKWYKVHWIYRCLQFTVQYDFRFLNTAISKQNGFIIVWPRWFDIRFWSFSRKRAAGPHFATRSWFWPTFCNFPGIYV